MFTDGKFDNFKFRSFYNLHNHVEDVTKQENDDFGSISVQLLLKYSTILNDYEVPSDLKIKSYDSREFKSIENLVQIRKMIIKLKTMIDNNSHTVEYYTNIIIQFIFIF